MLQSSDEASKRMGTMAQQHAVCQCALDFQGSISTLGLSGSGPHGELR